MRPRYLCQTEANWIEILGKGGEEEMDRENDFYEQKNKQPRVEISLSLSCSLARSLGLALSSWN